MCFQAIAEIQTFPVVRALVCGGIIMCTQCLLRPLVTFLLILSSVESLAASRPRVLVVGGNGRVGGSTAKHLLTLSSEDGAPVEVILGGRSVPSFEDSRGRIRQQLLKEGYPNCELTFCAVDLDKPESIFRVLEECRVCCVVHTAGPFQQRVIYNFVVSVYIHSEQM